MKAVKPPNSVARNQERYLLAERLTQVTYGTRTTYRLRGRLDQGRLRRALRETQSAHAILRTEFRAQGTGFAAWIRPEPDATDIQEAVAQNGDAAEIQRLFTDYFFRKPEAFVPREMIRTQVIQLPARDGEDELLLTFSLHHALSDGVSIATYAAEVLARYNGEPVPPTSGDYANLIAQAETTPGLAAQTEEAQAYWRNLLQGVEEVAEIPHDLETHVPLAEQRIGKLRLSHDVILDVARTVGASPFTVMAALSHLVLARYSGSKDVLSTFQSNGRRGLADNKVIGPFSNTLILRTRIDLGQSFPDLVAAQGAGIAGALANEAYPFHLVLRDTGLQPRFGLNWFPSSRLPRIVGATVLARETIFHQTNYDIDLRFVPGEEHVAVDAFYDSGRYSAERIDAILADLAQVLTRLTEDPRRPVGTLFDPPEPLVVAPPTRLPQGRLYDDVMARAREMPDRVALIGARETVTYGQLDSQSAALGRRLIAAGLGPGSRIAILAERGPQLVRSILAVLRIGATMVPLDSEYPEERLRTLVDVALPDAVLLPRRGVVPDWARETGQVLIADDPDAPVVDPAQVPAEALAAGDPDAPAYILFTSGSTGTPKGLATSHRPPLNFLRWQRETFGISADDRFTNLNGVAHDMMIRDIFAPLSVGAQLAIPNHADIFRPGRLLEWVVAQKPTVMHLTPAMGDLLAMARSREQTLPLRAMFFGGDRLQPEITERMTSLAPGAQIVNFYGATETPQAAAFHVTDPHRPWRTHPIGRGIENMQLRIVGPDRQPVPKGAPGEIAVVTPFLTLGYVKGREIVPHAVPGVYFTGDTGFELPSGEVMFTGRRDDQVSLRGYRIELDEVTRSLASHPAVREAQVLVDEGATSKLVGFAAGSDLSENVLHAWMARHLPNYMVPSEIVIVEALPLLPNGKLDRKTLLTMPRVHRTRAKGRAAETPMERRLIEIWKQHLEVDDISPEQSFAELRGDSLTLVQVFLATEAEVGQLPDHWEIMPLAEIAAMNAGPMPRFYKWVDSALLVRAVAISLVAALHLGVFSLGGGSTTALFMVSGYFLGRLQLVEAFRTESSYPVWRTFGRILLPVGLYVMVYTGAKLALGRPVDLSIPTFTVNFVDYAAALEAGERGHAIHLWYVDCLLQMLILLALLLAANFRWKLFESPARFLLALLATAAVLRFVVPGLLDPEYFSRGIEPNTTLAHLPTTHLGTLVLGMCMSIAQSLREKLGLALAVTAFAVSSALTSDGTGWAMLLFFGLLVLFVPRLPVPKGLHFLILVLSGSSLFIYLTHMPIAGALVRLGVPAGSFMLWALVLGAGVAVWLGWQQITPWRMKFVEDVRRVSVAFAQGKRWSA